MTTDYYPRDLATALQQRWPAPAAPLPPLDVLTSFISTLYQASLLAEEGRPVECHVVLATQAHLEAQPVTLTDFHLLPFAAPRPYNAQEVRRLSPAAHQPASLLAVAPAATGELQLWGMIFSEHAWDRLPTSPRPAATPPPALLVQLSGPGSLVFYHGADRLLTVQRGRIDGHGFLEFPRAWGEGHFHENRLLVGPALAAPLLTPSQEEFIVLLTLQMQRRALAHTRASAHGGLVVLVPTAQVAALTAPGGVLRPKYRLAAAGAGPRFPALVQALVRRLAELGEVSWPFYQSARDAQVLALTTEIDHFADYLAGLAAVDGALVLTQQVALVGFGVEIQATQVPLEQVYRALDVAGQRRQAVAADHGDTRHRAAYRLCLAAPECLAIVVSQDGNVQFVHNPAGQVVFWDQLSF